MNPVPHPPYSPDLAPSDFFLFLWVKKVLKGKCFANVEEVKQKMAKALKGIKMGEFKNIATMFSVLQQMESTLKVAGV